MQQKKNRPAWMDDESVKNIDYRKMEFLNSIFAEGQGKNQKEMMAMLLPAMQRAKKENLTFTPQEMSSAINAIKKYSTEEEIGKINKILEKSKNGGK